jgi:hypothetical protein
MASVLWWFYFLILQVLDSVVLLEASLCFQPFGRIACLAA